VFFDEVPFLFSMPAFKLFFSVNGICNAIEVFPMKEVVAFITRGEFSLIVSVLKNSGVEVIGYTDVQDCSVFVG